MGTVNLWAIFPPRKSAFIPLWLRLCRVGVSQEKSTADVAADRDVCPGYDAPKAMLKNPIPADPAQERASVHPLLVLPDRPQ
jgi:hypothetical protein